MVYPNATKDMPKILTLYISQRVQTGSRPADHNGLGRVEKAVINSHPLQAV